MNEIIEIMTRYADDLIDESGQSTDLKMKCQAIIDRYATPAPKPYKPYQFGKLSHNQRVYIRKLARQGKSAGDIAKRYNVTSQCIYNLLSGKTEKDEA